MFLIKCRNLFPVLSSVHKFGIFNVKMSSEAVTKSIAAICHMRSTNDKKQNLEQVVQIVEKAKKLCAQILFIPECCDYVGENRVETIELAEPLDGDLMKSYRELAKNNEIWLSLGGVHEATYNKDGTKRNKIYNAHVLINNCGEIEAVYRKLHLFDVVTPEFKFRESDVVIPGYELIPPLESPIGKLGLQICYDMRFAETSVLLNKMGAEILSYPSAFAYHTGKAHWEILLRARAIENQCFVIAPAQVGWHNKKRQSFGRGMIVDPWGKIIAECNNDNEADVVAVEINLNELKKIRDNMPCLQHRRNDAYSLTSLCPPVCVSEPKNNQKFAKHTINKGTVFYETNLCFAFTNLRCVVPGHVLVATKRNAHRLKDLTFDEITDIFQAVIKIQKMLEPIYEATSSTINVQDGPDSGQTVPHVHFHIMPRKKGDFAHNDLIYFELNKHDHEAETEERSLEERIEEASKYRQRLHELAVCE